MSELDNSNVDISKLSNNVPKQYNYVHHIKGPDGLGMSGDGTFAALEDDVGGLIKYLEVLISGHSKAQKNMKMVNGYKTWPPLGNKYLLKTLGVCTDVSSGNIVPRSLYINNIPTGNIPFISSLAGENFNLFDGLIPGLLENLEVFDPITIGESLFLGANPKCTKIELPVVDNSGITSTESAYILLNDLYNMDACEIDNSNGYCKPDIAYKKGDFYPEQCCYSSSGFQNIFPENNIENNIFEDKFREIYFIILALLGLYILLCLLHKSR